MPTGPSTSTEPYLLGFEPNVHFSSILTVGDEIANTDNTVVSPYHMVGVPDGLGAYDNGDGTITVLMNHEISNTQGIVREHGATGAFVSELVIDTATLEVVSAKDAIDTVKLWDDLTGTFVDTAAVAFNRFCSGDLAPITSYFNVASNLGSTDRIYLTGEEAGAEGRAFGIVTTGVDAGTAFELAFAGRFSWENAVSSPFAQDKTITIGTDDSTVNGQVYVYVGDKSDTGNAVEKAGLVGGDLYGIDVGSIVNETSGTAASGAFTLVKLGTDGDVSAETGAALDAESAAAGVTGFLRPEDCAWDPTDPNSFYFVTTNAFNSPSRLYKATFTDILHPENGGTITAVLDGTEGQQMLDNITVNAQGKVILQEDVGNQAHLGKIWQYDPVTDTLSQIANHDPALFVSGGPDFKTQDEESSGVIDVTGLLGDADTKAYLLDVQSHLNLADPELVQDGQLLVMYVETPVNGGADSDVINGDQNDNTLRGFDGDDEINGGSGNDTLRGDTGNDSIDGGIGNDYIRGGDGDDALIGGSGDDTLLGDTGVNTLEGGDGNDKLYGGDEIDTVLGGNGDDVVYGKGDDDSLEGGAGTDLIRGGDGNDFVLGGDDADKLLGDAGDDTVDGGSGADTIYGQDGADTLTGGDGNDIVRAGNDGDTVIGGDGNDLILGQAGDDILTGGAGADTLYGGAGLDSFIFTALGDSITGARDIVRDLDTSLGETIDLSAIDAIAGGADDAFTVVSAFTGTAGELAVSAFYGPISLVEGDVDGDSVADFSLLVSVVGGGALVPADFII